MSSLLTNPGILYGGSSILLFSAYLGVQASKNKISQSATRSIACSWSIISLIIMFIIMGIHASEEVGIASPQSVIVMYLLSVVTICCSSIILYSAF